MFYKNGLGYTLGDFFTNASGRPDQLKRIHAAFSALNFSLVLIQFRGQCRGQRRGQRIARLALRSFVEVQNVV
jgi:hypothetical protein